MHKTYLLLRNNKQTGPYSLEELVGLNLKPFDLVWVEGRSAGWRYPSEIETLKEQVPALSQTAAADASFEATIPQPPQIQFTEREVEVPQTKTVVSKQIFVRMPGNATPSKLNVDAGKKEYQEIKMQVPASLPEAQAKTEGIPDGLNHKYARSLHEVEEDYTNWVFKSKAKKFGTSDRQKAMILVFMLAGIVGICYALFFQPKTKEANTSVAVAMPEEKPAPAPVEKAVAETAPPKPNATSIIVATTTTSLHKKSTSNKASGLPYQKPIKKTKHIQVADNYAVRSPAKGHLPLKQAVSVPGNAASASKSLATSSPNKKKGLATVFNNLFARVKHPMKDEAGQASVPATIPAQMPGGRNARKRNDETAIVPQKEMTQSSEPMASEDLIEVSGNDKPENNWQLGMYNLKISVHNHNSVAVKQAVVTVAYLDENNRVLEKKTLHFLNVPARGTVTMSAPDQKWADHVEYALDGIQ